MHEDELAATLGAVFDSLARGEEREQRSPGFCVEVNGREKNVILSTLDAEEHRTRVAEATPAELLLHAVEIDHEPLRDAVTRLWEKYPLDGTDRAAKKEELAHLSEEVRETCELLREIDPLGYFDVLQRLEPVTVTKYTDLMEAGARLLNILEEPARAQLRLRNIFEIAFDGMERASQRERFAKLTDVFPSVLQRHFPMRWPEAPDGELPLNTTRMEFRVETPDDLYRLLLTLYFTQSRQRIARCECCFGYFIPKTNKETHFCDRVIDGKSCKTTGASWSYTARLDRDAALRAYDTLRHRKSAAFTMQIEPTDTRIDRRTERELMDAYNEWDTLARKARADYLDGQIDAAEFLRQIGCDPVDAAEPEDAHESEWQKRVAESIDFDPRQEYAGEMTLNLTAEQPRWEVTSAEEQTRKAQEGHRSLRDRYGKK